MTLPLPKSARPWLAVAAVLVLGAPAGAQPKPDLNEATEKAMKAASAKAAPTIVKIETAGGAETIGKKAPPGKGPPAIRKGTGPTTGLIVSEDGYIISSAFNFANKPTEIFITIPGQTQRLVAKIVATDHTRMLTLLKVEGKGLPVPEAFPKKDIEIGQWGLTLGRTLDNNVDHPPSMSVGIVSATNRIWGKAIQTDAKTSPVNYGGALVSIDGRVFGVIVPASNRAEGETAGVDVYDGGIGFAVPLEDIFRVLPRLKEGKDLKRGLLGINPQGNDVYNAAPIIGAIQPDSAAARAGLAVGDKIVEINGIAIPNYSVLQHVMGPMYESDEVNLKVSRGGKDLEVKGVKLLGTTTMYVNAFFGILPMRDDPGPGVEVRYVYPKSPADVAGIKAGDRIMKFGPSALPAPQPVPNRAAFIGMLQRLTPNTEVKVEVKRKEGDKVETLTSKVIAAPDELPEKLPLPSTAGKALEGQPKPKDPNPKGPKDPFPPGFSDVRAPLNGAAQDEKKDKPKIETGFMTRNNQALGREYWVFVPDNYDPNVSHGLIVWFHPAKEGGKDGEKMAKTFREFAEDHHFIVVGPKSGNADGWVASETELVMQDVKSVMGQYTIDRTRVVAHGMGNGGQMAFYVGFNARDVFRGVATIGATLGTAPKDNVANLPLSFFVSGGDKDPLLKEIVESKDLLKEKRFPVTFREMKESGKEYFDLKTFTDFLAWLDSLDRI
ncbi:MAG: PDZ domain-containing protein [Planctomycetes bacterium]|nr:PDZ domain-containing protein [Planctomycetota bacterium]